MEQSLHMKIKLSLKNVQDLDSPCYSVEEYGILLLDEFFN